MGLARAIILQPDYLLYDEPTSGLDPITSNEINELIISTAHNLEITSIVVTHDMHSVLSIAEKVAFLDNQTLSWFGQVEDMKHSDNKALLEFVSASEYQLNAANA